MKKCRVFQRLATGGYFLFLLLPVLGFFGEEILWDEPIWNGRRLGLMWNSCLSAFLSACGCVAIGIPAAARIHNGRLRNSGKRWFFLLLAPVPYYIYALTWMCLVRMIGKTDRRWFSLSMTGLLPCVLVNIMAFIPIVTGLVLTAMEHYDRQQEEIAQVYTADNKVLLKIVLPAIWPSVLAAGILVFILSVTDFSVPSLFQYQTYTLELFSEYSRGCSLYQIGLLALPMIFFVLMLVLCALKGLRPLSAGSTPMGKNGLHLTGGFSIAGNLAVLACILQLMVPLFVFVNEIKNWENVWKSMTLCAGELFVSAVISILASLSALLVAGPAGVWLTDKKFMWKVLALFPMAVPSSLVAMGLLRVVNGSFFHWLSQTVYFPALGCAVKYMPFAVLIFMARANRIPQEDLEIARIYTFSETSYFFKVLVPAYFPAILGSGILVFLLTLGDEGITLVLMPPGYETLAVKVYNYLHYGSGELVSGFCLITAAVTAGLMIGIWKLLIGKKRLSHRGKVNAQS